MHSFKILRRKNVGVRKAARAKRGAGYLQGSGHRLNWRDEGKNAGFICIFRSSVVYLPKEGNTLRSAGEQSPDRTERRW